MFLKEDKNKTKSAHRLSFSEVYLHTLSVLGCSGSTYVGVLSACSASGGQKRGLDLLNWT